MLGFSHHDGFRTHFHSASQINEAKRWFESCTIICRYVPNGKARAEKVINFSSIQNRKRSRGVPRSLIHTLNYLLAMHRETLPRTTLCLLCLYEQISAWAPYLYSSSCVWLVCLVPGLCLLYGSVSALPVLLMSIV